MEIRSDIETACGAPVVAIDALSGGCIGQVYRVEDANGRVLVAKVDDSAAPRLDVEGFMLTYLAEQTRLPVPQVLHSQPYLLLLSWLPGRSSFDAPAQEHAAELLAALHGHTAPQFGFERDTLIGGLRQPNTRADCWLDFFGEQRLRYMAARSSARRPVAGQLPGAHRPARSASG